MGRKKGSKNFKGCNEDCAHCPYPDCYKPVAEMKATRETVDISEKRDIDVKSQGKMYTFELGKYNSNSPNYRKKGWF